MVAALLALGAAGCSDDGSAAGEPTGDTGTTVDVQLAASEQFVHEVCGGAPSIAVERLLPSATFLGLSSSWGSWFGDSINCGWANPTGTRTLTAAIYVAPASDWRTHPAGVAGRLSEAAGFPIFITVEQKTSEETAQLLKLDETAPDPLLRHIRAELPAAMAKLCQRPISEIIGRPLDSDQIAENGRLCAQL